MIMRIRLSTLTRILALSALILLAGSIELKAQEYNNAPVSISKEKVKVGGLYIPSARHIT